jgi:TM2 domain-containing membrane protein YozV
MKIKFFILKFTLCMILIFLALCKDDDLTLFKSETQGNNFIKEENIIHLNRSLQSYCNPQDCPASSGFCKGDKCVCLEGFISVKDPINNKMCNYKQKQVIVSLLMESFGLIGFGHFYAGRIFYGLLKLICFYAIICYGSQFVIQFMKENSDTEAAYYVKLAISASCLGSPIIWHLIDLYKWATNQYLDGNDHAMLSW